MDNQNEKNDIIKFMLDESSITDKKIKEEFLNRYLNSDIDLRFIQHDLEKLEGNIKLKTYKIFGTSGKLQNIKIDLLEEKKYGTSGVYHVLVNNKYKAYLKSSPIKYVDDIDLSISEISKYFHVEVAKVFRVVDSNNRKGILSFDIRTKEDVDYVSLSDVYLDYYRDYKAGLITNLKYITELLSLPKTTKEAPLVREDYIKIVIDMGINILKDYFGLSDEQMKSIKKDYINILLFDYITNQTDRSLENINLEFYGDKVSFAPLYDNGCVYNEEIGKNNICLLDFICNRQAVIKTLFKYYYKEISENISLYLNRDNYISNIERVIKKNLSEKNAKWYLSLLNRNINQLVLLNNRYNKRLAKKETSVNVDLSLQFGYVKTFSLLVSLLLVLLFIVIFATMFYS